MNQSHSILKSTSGLTLIEVLLSIIIIATSAVAVLMWQKTSWTQTSYTNRLMVAGQVIEKQIEARRMLIAQSPATNFSTFKNLGTLSIADSSVKPPITVAWVIKKDTLKDPAGNLLSNVCWVLLKAGYGTRTTDTLQVITCIAKDF